MMKLMNWSSPWWPQLYTPGTICLPVLQGVEEVQRGLEAPGGGVVVRQVAR